jgi:hypothetical protein
MSVRNRIEVPDGVFFFRRVSIIRFKSKAASAESLAEALNHLEGEELSFNELQQKTWEYGDRIIPMLDGLTASEIDMILDYVRRTVTLYPIQIKP